MQMIFHNRKAEAFLCIRQKKIINKKALWGAACSRLHLFLTTLISSAPNTTQCKFGELGFSWFLEIHSKPNKIELVKLYNLLMRQSKRAIISTLPSTYKMCAIQSLLSYYFWNAVMKSPDWGNLSEEKESHGFRDISVPRREKGIEVGPSLCQ